MGIGTDDDVWIIEYNISLLVVMTDEGGDMQLKNNP